MTPLGSARGWALHVSQNDREKQEHHTGRVACFVHLPAVRHSCIKRQTHTEATISYATTHSFQRIFSRHVPSNNAVIIPKLRLGFMVSAFEYSEVYGPLVHLTYLVGAKRRDLYQTHSKPIVPSGNE